MTQWYYTQNGQRIGPFSDSQMQALVANRTVLPETLVWHAGLPSWTPASAAGLFSAPPASAPAPEPASAPAPSPAPASGTSSATAGTPPTGAPSPAAAPVGAAASPPPYVPPRASGGDAFGAGEILAGAFKLAVPNILSIIVAFVLWLLTLWIPYVNVGTTIAMATLPRKLAEGGVISPFFLFESRYRKYLGDFFVTQGLMLPALWIATSFLLVPGIVLGLSWYLALPLALEDNTSATEALSRSNELMAGHKWSAFFACLAVFIIQALATWLVAAATRNPYRPNVFLPLLVFCFFSFPYTGVKAALFRKLVLGQPL